MTGGWANTARRFGSAHGASLKTRSPAPTCVQGFGEEYADTSMADCTSEWCNCHHGDAENTLGSCDVGERRIEGSEAQTAVKYSMFPRILHRIDGLPNRYGTDCIGGQGIEPPTRGFSVRVPKRYNPFIRMDFLGSACGIFCSVIGR